MSERPRPYPVPPHIPGRPDYGLMPGAEPLDAELEQAIGLAVYGPRNAMNVQQLRTLIRKRIEEASHDRL